MKKPKHVHGYTDRHGKARFYVRRKGCRQVPLPGLPWAPEFMTAYEAAMAGAAPAFPDVKKRAGTVAALVHLYVNSNAFKSELAAETQRTRGSILRRFAREYGDNPVALLRPEHVKAMFEKKKAKRFAARNWLKNVRALMLFAIDAGTIKEDPTAGIKNLSGKSDGHRTWTEEDIALFEARWPIGSRERLAMTLGLYTGQRRGDVIRMGRQDVRDGVIAVRQEKTGVKLAIPVHPELKAILDAAPADTLLFLTTAQGRPLTDTAFGNWFHGACLAAGVPPKSSFHGLRKAACRRLAEAGCSANVIASISGHQTLKEIERYTKAADQARMARAGMATLVEQQLANLADPLAISTK
jgi:integrase